MNQTVQRGLSPRLRMGVGALREGTQSQVSIFHEYTGWVNAPQVLSDILVKTLICL